MAFKRYFATKDNTITDSYQQNLTIRATGSNMGQSDILEVFYIYGQQSATSEEKARILLEFPVTSMSSDRSSGAIPASGSVSFFLKLTNAKHSTTLPRDYKLTVHAVSGAWQEGRGLDMEEYTDLTYDNTGSNWVNANNTFVSASATLTALSKTAGEANTRVLTVADSSGNSVNFQIDNTTSTSTATKIGFSNANSNANQFATNMAAAINAANTAGTLNVVASAAIATVTLTQTAEGAAGNSAPDIIGTAVSDSVVTVVKQFSGGSGKWATTGGDFYTDSSSSFEATFTVGDENLEVDVTTLVEQWIDSDGNGLGSKDNNGFIIKLSSAYESSTTDSYYTKKFFARSSEFFFRRPVLEARWDSATRDNRSNLHYSSSALPDQQNLMSLYMYNYFRGNLYDIAGSSDEIPVLNLYKSSGSVPELDARYFRNSSNAAVNFLSSSRQSKGVYKATFSVTSSIVDSTYPYLVDVWTYSGSQVHTGSAITPQTHDFSNYNPNPSYVVSMPNLKKSYSKNETERFRLYVREKGWSPNIYTVAKTTTPALLIESASYKVFRVSDEKDVIPYNTGSDSSTMLSYDSEGNYFDLDMSMLEPGYTFAFKFSFYEESVNSYREQPHIFKFRMTEEEL